VLPRAPQGRRPALVHIGRDRRLSTLTVSIEIGQFFLKGWVEEFMTLLTQKHKQFGAADPLDDRLFCR